MNEKMSSHSLRSLLATCLLAQNWNQMPGGWAVIKSCDFNAASQEDLVCDRFTILEEKVGQGCEEGG